MNSIAVLGLGSCLLSHPLDPLIQSGRVSPALRGAGLRASATYCVDEAIQFARLVRGELDVPQHLRPVCDIDPKWQWHAAARECLAACDIVLLELYSPIRMNLGPYSMSRGSIINHVTDPMLTKGDDLRKPLHAWWSQGLLAGNDEIRAEAGELLAAAVDDTIPNSEVAREVFREARSYRRTEDELVDGTAAVRDLIGKPMGILVPIHQYLPDGRQLPWPPEFMDEVAATARRLDMPAFTPSTIVAEHGLANAWKGLGGPYEEAFRPVLGEYLFSFIQDVLRQTSH